MLPPPPRSTLFPYTTLFRSLLARMKREEVTPPLLDALKNPGELDIIATFLLQHQENIPLLVNLQGRRDRKSTRLNSSHITISYAVFCLKKKKKQQNN